MLGATFAAELCQVHMLKSVHTVMWLRVHLGSSSICTWQLSAINAIGNMQKIFKKLNNLSTRIFLVIHITLYQSFSDIFMKV